MKTTDGMGRQKGGRLRKRGTVLVLVLGVTLLMTVFVVSLLSFGLTERKAAADQAAGVESERLVDTAMALAISQLRDGTTRVASDGTPLPWTSQPGALRVHALDGSLQTLIKLYSARTMAAGPGAREPDELPRDWDRWPWVFADLNEPAVAPDPERPGDLSAAEVRFPIADPRQEGAGRMDSVEGFSYGQSGPEVNGVVRPGGEPNRQRLPMPVRWLYALEDGTLGVMDEAGRFSPVLGAGVPGAVNRVVGRLAFWTDDETCKINVNTASEGVHWDTPRCTTREELALAMKQPASGEYQRFPGHPAMVSLSSVLFPNRRLHAEGSSSLPRAGGPRYKDLGSAEAEGLWQLAPILNGSLAHTTRGGRVTVPELASAQPWPVVTDRTPRAGSAGELLWGATSPASPGFVRAPDALFAAHPDALRRLARGEFFLTAHSSAPELTLFGTPRIAVWPIHESVVPGQGMRGPVPRGSAHDFLMALTTTIGGRRYHWQRAAPGDGHHNFFATGAGQNKALFDYARALTSRPVPGFQRAGMDLSFAEKYGAGPADDRDAILLGIFDYIRQTNFNDAGLTPEQQFCVSCPADPQRGFGQVTPLFAGGTAKTRRTDQLKPDDLHAAKGIGRMLTVSEVSFVFTCLAEVGDDGAVRGHPSGEAAARELRKPGAREVQMAVVVEGFVPAQGWGEYRPYLALGLGGSPSRETDALGPLPDLALAGQPLRLAGDPGRSGAQPSPRFAFLKSSDDIASGWVAAGGMAGVRFAAADSRLSTVFTFEPVVVGPEVEALEFSGTPGGRPLQLAIYDTPEQEAPDPLANEPGPVATSDLMQVVPLPVPPLQGSLAWPHVPVDGTPAGWPERMRQAKSGGRLLSVADVVQSLVPAHGDHRLTAASRTLAFPPGSEAALAGVSVFVAHPEWGRSRHAHQLTDSMPLVMPADPDPIEADAMTGFIPGLRLPSAAVPDFPWRPFVPGGESVASTRLRVPSFAGLGVFAAGRLDGGRRGSCYPHVTGDFDNGVAWAPDGPYLNRPDDGEASGYLIGGVPYFQVVAPQPMRLPEARPRIWGANRQVPSAAMLGSLPTGVKARVPWQTLLFRPEGELDPAAWRAADGHYGWRWPRDHLLLDLFWMPVVEPVALSTPSGTEGKINLNHVLVPFGHIRRATALHAAFKAEKLLAIPDEASQSYKLPPGEPPRHQSFRRFIDADETLAQWDRDVFGRGEVFLSATQLCEHDLVPEGESGDRAAMRAFWARHRLSGDNSKERPYANTLGRFTTRSNSFRVHFRVEVLQPVRPGEDGRFRPSALSLRARREGSVHVERHLDPSNPDLPDAVAVLRTGALPPSLDRYYDWRAAGVRMFLR